MRDHREGFEKEAKLTELHAAVIATQNCLHQWGEFFVVARLINCELCEGAFERRPCRRKLQYIGKGHRYFVPREIYYSYDFNGSTYSIEGYSEAEGKVIGYAHFKLVDNDLCDHSSPDEH